MADNENEPGNEQDAETSSGGAEWIGVGLAIGMGVGVAIGAAMDNVALGVAFGPGIGLLFGVALRSINRLGSGGDDMA